MLGAIAVVAVTVGWFGRPIMQSVLGGDESVVPVGEGVEARPPAQVTPPAVASAAVIGEAQDVPAAQVADSQIPQQEPQAEPLQTPRTQTEPQPQARVVPVVTPPAQVEQPVAAPAPVRLPSVVGTVRSERSGAPLSGAGRTMAMVTSSHSVWPAITSTERTWSGALG